MIHLHKWFALALNYLTLCKNNNIKFFLKEKDLYALLEIEPDADEKTIKKAYRKKALTCHPDKNPDNEVF